MRSRTVVSILVRMCGVLLAVMAARAHAAAQDSAQPVRLGFVNVQFIRCTAASDKPCFRFDLNVLDAAGSAANIPGAADPEHFQVIQTAPHRELRPFFVSTNKDVVSSGPGKRYVLVLFDVSGSMKNSLVPGGRRKIEVAKEALSAGLTELSAGSDLVAIAPFENHNLDSISSVPFVSDLDAAGKQVQQLSVPRGQADTGLYSAVVKGLELLASQPEKYEKVLVVFTDGKNDVGDQHHLLSGPDGRSTVVARARESQLPIWTIGLGSGSEINEAELREIAYPDAEHYIKATDADGLRRAFRAATRQFFNRIRVTVQIEDSFQKLAAGDREFQVRFRTANGNFLTTPRWPWSSPVSGLEPPSSHGDVAETEAHERENSHPENPPLSRGVVQISTFLFYALFLSFLWFIVPRMLWPHRYQPDDAVDRRIEADTPARYRPNRRPIEDPSVTVGEGTLEIPDVHYDRGAQPARTGRSPSAPEDPGLTRIFEEESPEQLASEAKSTRVSTSPGAPTTTFGEGVRAPAGAEDPSISKIFKTEEARNELRHSSRNDMEGLETVTLPPPNLQKPPQPPMKEPAADVGNLKNRLDEPRWPEQSLDSTGPVVMHRRTIDSGPGEHPVVIAGRRTKVSPTESIVPAQPAKNVGAVPPAPPEPARKALDPRFVLLLVLNLTFLLVAGVLLYFSLRR